MEDLYGSTFQTVPRFACASGDLPDRGCTPDDCIASHLHAFDNMLIRAVQILTLRAIVKRTLATLPANAATLAYQ